MRSARRGLRTGTGKPWDVYVGNVRVYMDGYGVRVVRLLEMHK